MPCLGGPTQRAPANPPFTHTYRWGRRGGFVATLRKGGAREGVAAKMRYLCEMRVGSSEAMLFMGMSQNTIYGHIWSRERNECSLWGQGVAASIPFMSGKGKSFESAACIGGRSKTVSETTALTGGMKE